MISLANYALSKGIKSICKPSASVITQLEKHFSIDCSAQRIASLSSRESVFLKQAHSELKMLAKQHNITVVVPTSLRKR